MLERLKKLINYFYCKIVYRDNYIVINGWFNIFLGKIKKRNFGDELNYYLLNKLVNKNIIGKLDIPNWDKQPNYMVIGSIVEEFTTTDSVIWGSGAISGQKPLKYKPSKVCAVRGKLTRNYLLGQGVECPEIYGDPALLLPYIYSPTVKKKYLIGLIPHINDLSNPIISKLIKDERVHLINFESYQKWEQVIDEICECEIVVSSSLHGLIISDSYKIPNVWITISNNILGGTFKYHDYFSGVNREIIGPTQLTDFTSIEELISIAKDYKPITFDPHPLIEAAPFNMDKFKI